MARIYKFETGEVIHDSPVKESILKKYIGKSVARASLRLTEESVMSRDSRINEAIRAGLAAQQARRDFGTSRSGMTKEEVIWLNVQQSIIFESLSSAERQEAMQYIGSVTNETKEVS